MEELPSDLTIQLAASTLFGRSLELFHLPPRHQKGTQLLEGRLRTADGQKETRDD